MVESVANLDKPKHVSSKVYGKKIRIVAYDPDKLEFHLQDGPINRCEAMRVELQRMDSGTGRLKIGTLILTLILTLALIATAFAYYKKANED